MHTRSLVGDGNTDAKLPAGQSVHAMQLEPSIIVLNVPPGHAEHTRSAVGVPSVTMYDPGAQIDIGTQGVAGLASSSNMPTAHVNAGDVAPAQYWPATHTVQIVGEVDVPAPVCTVPASHAPSGRQLD